MHQLRLGFLGVSQLNFDTQLTVANYAAARQWVQELAEGAGGALEALPASVVETKDAIEALSRFAAAGVELLLVQTTCFASGEVASEIASYASRYRIPVVLWGIPEPTGGALRANSFCCQNFYTSILHARGVPFKWVWGAPGAEELTRQLERTVTAVRALEQLRRTKVAVLGSGRVPGFYGSNFDELALKERFGVSVSRIDLSEVFRRAAALGAAEAEAGVVELRDRTSIEGGVTDEALERVSRMHVALTSLAAEGDFDGLAIRCWPEYVDIYGTVVCANIGLLNDEGIVTSDEADLLGLVSMLCQRYVTQEREVPTLLDWSYTDFEANAVGLWHCGATACGLARAGTTPVSAMHSILGRAEGETPTGVVIEQLLRLGPATVFRLCGAEGARALCFTGEVMDSPMIFQGAYASLKLDDLEARDLVNTILVSGVEHHYSLCYTRHEDELDELMYWLDVEPLEVVPYDEGRGAFARWEE